MAIIKLFLLRKQKINFSIKILLFMLIGVSCRPSVYEQYSNLTVNFLADICQLQTWFLKDDADGNNINDYWVGDFSGLYRLIGVNGGPICYLADFQAKADLYPLKKDNAIKIIDKISKPLPFHCYYYCVMKYDEDNNLYDNGTHRNKTKYAFIAIPEQERIKDGWKTYIVNQDGIIYGKYIRDIYLNNKQNKINEKYFRWPTVDPTKYGWKIFKKVTIK